VDHKPIKILIYGSCVSRDIFNFYEASSFSVVNYFARSSLISVYGEKVVKGEYIEKLESPFQQKIVAADLDKHFVEKIGMEDFDLLLLDFIDERFNLYRFENGAICTLSNELLSTGCLDEEKGKVIFSGSDEFLVLWEKAWNTFVEHMKLLKIFHKVRLHKTYWCYGDAGGKNYEDQYSISKITEANSFLDKLYLIAQKDLDVRQVITYKEKPVGAIEHKWGRSPYHFTDQYYIDMIKLLADSYVLEDCAVGEQRAYDPYALHKPVYSYKTLEEALSNGMNQNGIHNIYVGNGRYIDICIEGLEFLLGTSHETRFLLVGFSGAVSNREGKRAPFFSGLSIAAKLKSPIIAVADSSLSLDTELGLAWYAGNENQKVFPQQIAALLDTLAKVFNAKLLLFGGSGGGFAALTQATLLTSDAIVYVWNPQTEIAKYVPEIVEKYDSVAFRGKKIMDVSQHNSEYGFSSKVIHNLCNRKINPNIKLLYMQNQSDWHMREHALAYIENIDLRQTGNATYVNEYANHVFFFGSWGFGHAVPSEPILLWTLKSLIKTNNVLSTALELDKGIKGIIEKAPRFLKLDDKSKEFPYEFNVEIKSNKLMVYCELCAEDQIEYAFYLLLNGKRVVSHWYSPTNTCEFQLPEEYDTLEIMYFIKDLFGTVNTTKYLMTAN